MYKGKEVYMPNPAMDMVYRKSIVLYLVELGRILVISAPIPRLLQQIAWNELFPLISQDSNNITIFVRDRRRWKRKLRKLSERSM